MGNEISRPREEIPSLTMQEKLKSFGFDIAKGRSEKIPGDTKVGNIIYIKQIHNDYKQPHYLELSNPKQYQALIRYQKEIYGELARQKVTHIFIEGLRAEQQGSILSDWKKMIKPGMKDSQTRDEIFATYGGAMVYAIENNNVTLHATESSDIVEEINKYSELHLDEEVPVELNEKREDFAIKQIQIFLQKKPGSKVVLIFGALHNFRDNIGGVFQNKKPTQEIITFPELAREYIQQGEKAPIPE